MSYPNDTAAALLSIGYNYDDFLVEKSSAGTFIREWHHADPQPTEQQITDTIASQAFIDWQAEHGGDPVLTRRRVAKDILLTDSPEMMVLRAFLKAYADRESLTKAQVLTGISSNLDAGDGDT